MLKKLFLPLALSLALATAQAVQPGEPAPVASVGGDAGSENAGLKIGLAPGIDSGLLDVLDGYLYSLTDAAWAVVSADGSFELLLPDLPLTALEGPNHAGLCPDETPFLAAQLRYLNVRNAADRTYGEARLQLPAAEDALESASVLFLFVTEELAFANSCSAGMQADGSALPFTYDLQLEPGWNALILSEQFEQRSLGPMTMNFPTGRTLRSAPVPGEFRWIVEAD